MSRAAYLVVWLSLIVAPAPVALAQSAPPATQSAAVAAPQWLTDYAQAVWQAREQQKMLLIYFRRAAPNALRDCFEAQTLAHREVQTRLARYVCLRLDPDQPVRVGQEQVQLLGHSAFREMLGREGVAILDFAHPQAPYHTHVVSTFPLLASHCYTPARMTTILDLPPGTLTQRTLIYAVRVHPECPASTRGQIDPALLREAESHSTYQARIRVQGHHGWGSRFQRITSRLPRGLLAAEVCAESWPGQRLLESALECVRCWRLSSGHWRSVRSYQPVYGYDMKRGANGVWYATGVFGGRG